MLEHEPIHVEEPTDAAAAAANAPAATPQPRGVRAIDGVTACVALLIALAGGGLYAMHLRTSAGAARVAAIQASTTDVDTVLAGGRESIAALSRSVRATHELVARLTHHSATDIDGDHVQLASALTKAYGGTVGPRDPFIFKTAEPPAPDAPSTPTGPSDADRESQRATALAAARQLQVQSIIHGSSRGACLINGRLYFEGQAIDDRFTVQSISSDSVIVRTGDFRFELRLKK